jgi:integrase
MQGLYLRRKTWWIKFTAANGERVYRSLGTHDEAEAIGLAVELKAEFNSEAREQMGTCAAEIQAYVNFIRGEGLAESTVESREYVLKGFVEAIGARTPRGISAPAIAKWFTTRRSDYEATAIAYLNIVKYWLKWLVKEKKLAADPGRPVKVPKKTKMRLRRRFLLKHECDELLEACKDPGLKFAVFCGLHQGMRKNEIIEARANWFDLDAGLLHIQATPTFAPKDREERSLPLTSEFKAWLEEEYGLHSPFMLEPEKVKGKYRYRYDFRKVWGYLVKRCKFQDLTFHDLRRTFASLHASAGTSIYKIAKWLGDEVEVVERHYGHLIPQDDQINAVWSAPAKKKPSAKKQQRGPYRAQSTSSRPKPGRGR